VLFRSREEIQSVLGDKVGRIHHIGSTSVPGLAAKPVIDILIEATDITLIDHATPHLEALGYNAKGEYGIARRRYFSRPPGIGLKVHVHAFSIESPQVFRHLVFRDYLRTNSNDMSRYGELKHALADEHRSNRAAYQAGKEFLIEEILSRTAAWYDKGSNAS